MRGRRRLRGDDLPIKAEVNVTSLVDIAFVLLVIFIITAPILSGSVQVDLPSGEVQPLVAADQPFIVSVMPDGRVFVEGTEFSLEDFEGSFPQLAAAGKFERVYIQGDTLAQFGRVMRVVETVRLTGKPFAFVVQQRGGAR